MMNCKVGDIAQIIYALGGESGTGANIGLYCEVLAPIGVRNTSIGPLFHWKIEICGIGKDADGIPAKIGKFPDKYLRPLPPLTAPETTARRETEKI